MTRFLLKYMPLIQALSTKTPGLIKHHPLHLLENTPKHQLTAPFFISWVYFCRNVLKAQGPQKERFRLAAKSTCSGRLTPVRKVLSHPRPAHASRIVQSREHRKQPRRVGDDVDGLVMLDFTRGHLAVLWGLETWHLVSVDAIRCLDRDPSEG